MKKDILAKAQRRSKPDGHVHATAAYVTDQAVCSAGNFFTSFLAAKHLPADQFGAFALLNVLMVFGLTVNNWLIRSNLSRTAQLGDPGEVKAYTATLAGLAAWFGLAPALVLIGAAFVLHHGELSLPLALVAIAGQVQETLRRSTMAQGLYRIGLAGDAVSYLGQALIIFLLVLSNEQTLERIFWVLGATSVASLVLQAYSMKLKRPTALAATARQCWEQGRWITLSGLLLSPLVYGTPWILELARGQREAGMLSALILVLGVSNPLMFSTTWLILVRGQAAKQGSFARLLKSVLPPAILTSVPLLLYWLLLFFFPHRVLQLFFGGRGPYAQLDQSLQLVVVYYLVSYIAVCLEVMTDTREKSRQRVGIDTGASLLMLCCGLLASWKYGLQGLLVVGILAHALRVLCYTLLLAAPHAELVSERLSEVMANKEVSL